MQWLQRRLHERRLAIENVDAGIGRLAVDTQRHVKLRHLALRVTGFENANQHRVHVVDVRHSLVAVCGRTGGVVFARVHDAALARLDNLLRRCAIGEVTSE